MLIDNSISEVFQRDKKVFIPDFGALIYSEFNDAIDINELLNFDDGKIVAEIQRQESVTEEQAAKKLHEFVENLKTSIEKKGTYFIGGIGYINKGEDGALTAATSISEPVFLDEDAIDLVDAEEVQITEETQNVDDSISEIKNEPDEQIDSLAETSIEQETDSNVGAIISEEELLTTNEQEIEKTLESDAISEESEILEGEVDQEESIEPDYSYRAEEEDSHQVNEDGYESTQKRKNPILIALAAILVVAVIAVPVYLIVFKADSQDNKAISTSALTAGEVQSKIEPVQRRNEEIVEENEPISNTDKVSVESPDKMNFESDLPHGANEGDLKIYSLILGSFKVESNADNFERQLNGKRIEVNKFRRNGSFYFVGIEQIPGKPNAVQLLAKLRNEEEPTAWIIRTL